MFNIFNKNNTPSQYSNNNLHNNNNFANNNSNNSFSSPDYPYGQFPHEYTYEGQQALKEKLKQKGTANNYYDNSFNNKNNNLYNLGQNSHPQYNTQQPYPGHSPSCSFNNRQNNNNFGSYPDYNNNSNQNFNNFSQQAYNPNQYYNNSNQQLENIYNQFANNSQNNSPQQNSLSSLGGMFGMANNNSSNSQNNSNGFDISNLLPLLTNMSGKGGGGNDMMKILLPLISNKGNLNQTDLINLISKGGFGNKKASASTQSFNENEIKNQNIDDFKKV